MKFNCSKNIIFIFVFLFHMQFGQTFDCDFRQMALVTTDKFADSNQKYISHIVHISITISKRYRWKYLPILRNSTDKTSSGCKRKSVKNNWSGPRAYWLQKRWQQRRKEIISLLYASKNVCPCNNLSWSFRAYRNRKADAVKINNFFVDRSHAQTLSRSNSHSNAGTFGQRLWHLACACSYTSLQNLISNYPLK